MTRPTARDVVDGAVQAVALAAVLEALPRLADGRVQLAPQSVVAEEREHGVVVADIDGRRFDVVVTATLRRHMPPGWPQPAKYGVGDVVELTDANDGWRIGARRTAWEVREVLGTREDPRPGYRLAAVEPDPGGGFVRVAGGREWIATLDLEAHASYLGHASHLIASVDQSVPAATAGRG